jgi:hypothetical protein
MRISRRSVRPGPSEIRSRVELLPQSNAATTSVTHVLALQEWDPDRLRDEFTDGIITVDQVVCQVRVKTLDTHSRTTHASRGVGEIITHGGRTTSQRVSIVRALEFNFINHRLETVHAPLTLEATHGVVQLTVDKPVERRHGRPVAQVGLILDDHRPTIDSSHDHRTTAGQRSTEQRFNGGEVSG